MQSCQSLQYKIASESWEFEAILRLNYQTFVEEIPQHAPNPEGRLVDRFHSENHYVIAVHGQELVGMLALRWQRPFSLDAKVPDLDRFLPVGRRPVEARLLAVVPTFRRTAVFAALFQYAARYCLEAGFDLAVISGTTRQLVLYRHLGFIPFGPLVGTATAQYQPMFLTLEAFRRTAGQTRSMRGTFAARPALLNLVPGPVQTTPAVDAAFAAPAVSHRGPEFHARLREVRERLCQLTGAREVQVLPGSGSLATAVVAAQLSLRDTTGLVLSNGEFGERLAAEARRARLRHDTLQLPWGTALDLAAVNSAMARLPRGSWLWCVHHETSTGMRNPLAELVQIAARHGVDLCVDCISSIGALPVNLRGVHLATGTSGKGLGSYPGLALVFHHHAPNPEPERLPGYLDLGHWAAQASIPHTHSSNLVGALAEALRAVTPERLARIRENSAWLRSELRAHGWPLVTPEESAAPGIVTIALDDGLTSSQLGEELEQCGFALSFRSGYLLTRNWIQISLFSDPARSELERLLELLRTIRRDRTTGNVIRLDDFSPNGTRATLPPAIVSRLESHIVNEPIQ